MDRRTEFRTNYAGDVLPSECGDITSANFCGAMTIHADVSTSQPSPLTNCVLRQSIGCAGNRAIFIFNKMQVTCGNTTAISFGKVQLATFPKGRIRIEGGTFHFGSSTVPGINWGADVVGQTATIPGTGGSGDCSFGTTGTADSTLSGTDVDIAASQAFVDPFVARLGQMNAVGTLVKSTEFDGTSTAKNLFFNVIIDDADVADADSAKVEFTGVLVVNWVYEGLGSISSLNY